MEPFRLNYYLWSMERRSYFPNLDGLRFIGFLMIFLSHAFFSDNPDVLSDTFFLKVKSLGHLGFAGLDFFFVLSAFLITWTLLSEIETKGKMKFGAYFLRRTLRIWPLYFFIVGLGFIGAIILNAYGISTEELPGFGWFATFTLNYYCIYQGTDFLFFLVFFWTIAVEEQFYIGWGLIMKFFSKYVSWIVPLLILVSVLFRWWMRDDSAQLSFNTLNYMGDFAIGILLADAVIKKNELYENLVKLSRSNLLLVYLLLIVLLVFYHPAFDSGWSLIMERLVFSILFGVIVFEQCFSENRLFNAGAWKPVRYLGKISYGLYCFHGVVITVLMRMQFWTGDHDTLIEALLVKPAVILMMTVFFSVVSFEFFEKRIIKKVRHS